MTRTVFVFIILLALVPFSGAQTKVADSLQNLIRTLPTDSTKLYYLNLLVQELRDKDPAAALAFANQATALGEMLNNQPGLAQAQENLSWIHYRLGNFSKAMDLGNNAFELAEYIRDSVMMAKSLNNIASILFEQKNYEAAVYHFRKSYQISAALKDCSTMARSLNNIAYVHVFNKAYDSAENYANRGYLISRQCNNHYMEGFAARTLGDVEVWRNNYAKALSHFEAALALGKQTGNTFLQVSTRPRLAKCLANIKQFSKAVDLLEENILHAKQSGFREELETSYLSIAQIHASQNDMSRAYSYLDLYRTLHDSLATKWDFERKVLLEAKYDSKMKEAQIELLTKDTLLKQKGINQQRVWMYFVIGCLTLLFMLAFVLFINNRTRNRANRVLQQKNEEIQQQAQQLANLNMTKDKLFSVISHDLRSPLSNLRGMMDLVVAGHLSQNDFIELSAKVKRNLESVHEDLDNLLLWAQSQLKGLKASPESFPLNSVLDEVIALYKDSARNKAISIVNDVEEDIFIYADKNHIRIVLRNLLGNAIKFNKDGGLIVVRQTLRDGKAEIAVHDSGVGLGVADLEKLFNEQTHFTQPGTRQEKGAGIGLLLVKEFVEINGGAIWVTSELGKGSTFTFSVQCDYKYAMSKVV